MVKDGTKESVIVEEHSLKKPIAAASSSLRRTQLASVEWASGVADAISHSWKSFRAQLAESTELFDGRVVAGSVEAAATFLEGVAKATRRSYEQYHSHVPVTRAVETLDYEKLAKLVAAELRPVVK